MIIDLLTTENVGVIRYESDIVPGVGSVISDIKLRKSWRVISIEHLIKKRLDISTEPYYLELITIVVQET